MTGQHDPFSVDWAVKLQPYPFYFQKAEGFSVDNKHLEELHSTLIGALINYDEVGTLLFSSPELCSG